MPETQTDIYDPHYFERMVRLELLNALREYLKFRGVTLDEDVSRYLIAPIKGGSSAPIKIGQLSMDPEKWAAFLDGKSL